MKEKTEIEELNGRKVVKKVKIGSFKRFKPALKRKRDDPYTKFWHAVYKDFNTTVEKLIEDGYTVSEFVVNTKDEELLHELFMEWASHHTFLKMIKPEMRYRYGGIDRLNYSPANSADVPRGWVYLREPWRRDEKE